MKKAISVLLLTVMCAMVFVGCGSGESNTSSLTSSSVSTTSSGSIKRKSGYNQVQVGRLPHTEQYALNSPKDRIIKIEKLTLTTGSDVYQTTGYSKEAVGKILFDTVLYKFKGDNIDQIIYSKKSTSSQLDFDFKSVKEYLTGLYGTSLNDGLPSAVEQENSKMTDSWFIQIPSGETYVILLSVSELSSSTDLILSISAL